MSSTSRFILSLTVLSMTIVSQLMAQSIDSSPSSSPSLSPSPQNGHLVDSLKRFPHHVTIETESNRNDGNRLCGGSILSSQWILTSGLCVEGSDRLHLHFKKIFYSLFSFDDGSFSIMVNKDEIYMHPTLSFDIALIRLPVELIFSDTLKPIAVSSIQVSQFEGKLAVMPGFDVSRPTKKTKTTTTTTTTTSIPEVTSQNYYTTTSDIWTTSTELPSTTRASDWIQPDRLLYGMFRVLSNQKCQDMESSKYNEFDEFDEFLQMCTENWAKSNEIVSCWNPGNGLLVGWPAKPQLIGIYSVLLNDNCGNSRRGVYTNIEEYLPWIESIIDVAP